MLPFRCGELERRVAEKFPPCEQKHKLEHKWQTKRWMKVALPRLHYAERKQGNRINLGLLSLMILLSIYLYLNAYFFYVV